MEDRNFTFEDYPTELDKYEFNGYGNSSEGVTNETKKKQHPGIKILMYHRIVEDRFLSNNCRYCLHVNEFCRQLEILIQLGYTPVTFHDFHLFRIGELQLPKKPVIITFDDGYLDTYILACPMLVEFGMRAVVFVMGDRSLKTNQWDKYRKDIPVASLMEDHHVQKLHARGFEIGAHALSHANLSHLPEEDAYYEIKTSKLILESLIGVSVQSFAYPLGSVNASIKKMIAKIGYQFACGVYSGPARFGEDLLEIRRIEIHNKMSQAEFLLRMKTPFEYIEWVKWKTKKIRSMFM